MNLTIKDKIKINARKIFIRIAKFFIRGYGLSKFAIVRKIFNRAYSLVQGPGFIIPVGEFKMLLDEKDTLGLSLGRAHEPHITKLAKKQINEGDTVVDIGANIGYFTLIFSKLVGPKGKVFAFEPDPTNFSILKENILLNKCLNIVPLQKAVSEYSQKGTLYLNEENRGDHRIFDSGDNRKKIDGIEITNLDDYFKNHKKINFIKMDTQGCEILALRGMRKIIEENKEIKILSEFWPNGFNKAKTNPKEFFDILREYGFCFFENSEIGDELIPIKNTQSFLENYSQGEEDAASVFSMRCK
jgi:FkbM family methyltransferase